jgi:hypothetical protein
VEDGGWKLGKAVGGYGGPYMGMVLYAHVPGWQPQIVYSFKPVCVVLGKKASRDKSASLGIRTLLWSNSQPPDNLLGPFPTTFFY